MGWKSSKIPLMRQIAMKMNKAQNSRVEDPLILADDTVLLSVRKERVGGLGLSEALARLKVAGIEAKPALSPYPDQIAVKVDKKHAFRAMKVLY